MKADATSLDRLHDIIVPDPVPWWPPAAGWYWVLAFSLVALWTLLLRGLLLWQHNRYRREALAILSQQEAVLHQSAPPKGVRAASLLTLAQLLKRTAVTAFPRHQVAALTGTAWFEFLDETAEGTAFADGCGNLLENAVYKPKTADALSSAQLHEVTSMIRRWINTHDPGLQQQSVRKTSTNPIGQSSSKGNLLEPSDSMKRTC